MRWQGAWRDLWYLHRRAILVAGALLLTLLAVVTAAALATRSTHVRSLAENPESPARPRSTSAGTQPTPAASDVARWDAISPVVPATSLTFPALSAVDRSDPAAFARAFVTELFTRDYARSSRSQLASWAQFHDAPLRSTRYPEADWSKVLVNSLTDLSWDGATQTPVPADGPWQALAAGHAIDSVSQVSVRTDPQWESTVAGGYEPPDQLTTVQDVAFRLTRQTAAGARRTVTRYDISIALQLGTAPDGGYGAAATNNFVMRVAD